MWKNHSGGMSLYAFQFVFRLFTHYGKPCRSPVNQNRAYIRFKKCLEPSIVKAKSFQFPLNNKRLLHLDTKKSECSLKLILSSTMTPKNLVSVAGDKTTSSKITSDT